MTLAQDLPQTWPQDLRDLIGILRGAGPEAPERIARAIDLGSTRHRLGPYLAELMRGQTLPAETQAQLAQEAQAAAFAALAQKAETQRCLDALGVLRCRPVLAKGWPLAEQLFGSAALRHSKDIDLHIGEPDLPQAVAAITDLGYLALHKARLRLAQSGDLRLTAETNDIAFYDLDGHVLELHWRLTHLRGWIRLDAIPEARVPYPLETGGTIDVLSDRAALIYLSVHGQLHMWGRLKWLVDIAQLLPRKPDREWCEDLAIAERLNSGRAVRIAVHLAHIVLGARLPEGWPAPSWLERRAIAHFLHLIASPGGEPGQTKARLHYHLCVMAYGEGLTQRLASPRYALLRNLRIWWAARGAP